MIQWKEACQSLSLTFTAFLASKVDVKLIGLCSRCTSDGLAGVGPAARSFLYTLNTRSRRAATLHQHPPLNASENGSSFQAGPTCRIELFSRSELKFTAENLHVLLPCGLWLSLESPRLFSNKQARGGYIPSAYF